MAETIEWIIGRIQEKEGVTLSFEYVRAMLDEIVHMDDGLVEDDYEDDDEDESESSPELESLLTRMLWVTSALMEHAEHAV